MPRVMQRRGVEEGGDRVGCGPASSIPSGVRLLGTLRAPSASALALLISYGTWPALLPQNPVPETRFFTGFRFQNGPFPAEWYLSLLPRRGVDEKLTDRLLFSLFCVPLSRVKWAPRNTDLLVNGY